MVIRIGITQVVKEVEIDLGEDGDLAAAKTAIEAGMAGEGSIIWLTDKKGREVGVPGSKIAYVDLGTPADDQRIGFG